MSNAPEHAEAAWRRAMQRITDSSVRQMAWWDTLARRGNPIVLIVIAWALLTLPLVFLRGFNSDEGVAVSVAQTALADGYWLTPHISNTRFVERPTLLSWAIGAISLPFGEVSQFTARLPIVLLLLGGALLVFDMLRRAASLPAALFGAALFLAAPIVLRSYVMTTADLPLAILLFLAFVLWWNGHAAGGTTLARGLAVGAALAAVGLLKGPQPVAYFAFGVGLFILLSRSWREIPAFVLAGVVCVVPLAAWYAYVFTPGDTGTWSTFMRLGQQSAPLPDALHTAPMLFVLTLPASLLAAVFLATGRLRGDGAARSALVTALCCYAFTCSVVVLFWPGGSAPRYFLPMVPPLCVLGGLAYDALAARWPAFVATMLTATLGLLTYGLIYSVVAAPLMPERFRATRIDGARIADAVRAAPGPIYRTGATGLNELLYVRRRIVNAGNVNTVQGPGWFVVPADTAAQLLARRKGAVHPVLSFGRNGSARLLRLDR